MSHPIIKPIDVKEYTSKQSKYDVVGKLPLRDIMLGSSRTRKRILLSNMILDICRRCFDRIYIHTQSIDVDKTWISVKEYIEKFPKVYINKEKLFLGLYKHKLQIKNAVGFCSAKIFFFFNSLKIFSKANSKFFLPFLSRA